MLDIGKSKFSMSGAFALGGAFVNRAQDAIVKLKAEIGRHVETKQGWNQQSQWARGTVALINEANQCIETQLAKRNHIIQEMDVTCVHPNPATLHSRVPKPSKNTNTRWGLILVFMALFQNWLSSQPVIVPCSGCRGCC